MTKTTSWGGEANWYDQYLKEETYHSEVIWPNLKRILNLRQDMKVLDLACGQGFFSFEMSKIAGEVLGIDIAPELIKIAKERAKNVSNVNFIVKNAEKLQGVEDKYYDLCLCTLAAQNIENFGGAIKEVSLKLKKAGRFVFVINHPTYRIPKESDWYYSEKDKKQGRVVYRYLSEEKIKIDMHPGKQGASYTYSFHRPIQVYSKWLHNAGFIIERIEEWGTYKKSNKGSRYNAEEIAKREIPMFMCIECRLN